MTFFTIARDVINTKRGPQTRPTPVNKPARNFPFKLHKINVG